jgi:hypothetical protein
MAMSKPDEPDSFDDDEPMWNCPCGEFVDGDHHCPRCGGCQPWGCGGDMHDGDEDREYEVDFSEEGLFERDMEDALGPPLPDEEV